MLSVKTSKDFDRDLRKQKLTAELLEVLSCLYRGEPLPAKYKDHALHGDKKGWRDCHVQNDLVLIYKIEAEQLILVRLGSHSELFG